MLYTCSHVLISEHDDETNQKSCVIPLSDVSRNVKKDVKFMSDLEEERLWNTVETVDEIQHVLFKVTV